LACEQGRETLSMRTCNVVDEAQKSAAP
jgi:hypothetical protein